MKISTVKLGSICTFQSGGTPSRSIPEYWEGNIPWITTVALNGGYINEKDTGERITETALAKSAAKLVPAQSLMVGTRVGVGKVAINTVPMSTSQDVVSLIGIDEEKWYKPYLSRFLQGKSHDLQSQSRGATIKGIKIEMLSELNVPLISLEEQIRISKLLDTVETLILTRKQQLTELDTLVKARFVEMFGEPECNTKGWPLLNISELCTVGSSKRIYQSEQAQEGIPFLRIADLTNLINTGTVTAELYIPEMRYAELQAQGQVPVKGDILITSRGTLGQCYIVKEDDRFYFQDGMISWLSKFVPDITPTYISYLFAMPGFRKQIYSMQAGSTVAYLSIAMIKKLKAMVPSVELQAQFATFVTQVNQTKSVVQKALDEAQTLFDSLMQQYFG